MVKVYGSQVYPRCTPFLNKVSTQPIMLHFFAIPFRTSFSDLTTKSVSKLASLEAMPA